MNAFYEINLLKPFSIGANDPTESPCIGSLVISTYTNEVYYRVPDNLHSYSLNFVVPSL